MADILKQYKIFIASPEDVTHEHQIIRDICDKLNNNPLIEKKNVRLKPASWKDAIPAAGDPREITRRLQKTCDLFVCLFHRTFDTARCETLELFLNAYESWKQMKKPSIMLYFKEAVVRSKKDITEQLNKVLDFKEKVVTERLVLFQDFKNAEEFTALFEKHLTTWISEYNPEEPRPSRTPAVQPPSREEINETLKNYLAYTLGGHCHLPVMGFETKFRNPILLERVYVKMRAHPQLSDFEYCLEDKKRIKNEIERQEIGTLTIDGALGWMKDHKVKDMIILGDPGAGKTTLLKYMCVMLAEGKGRDVLGIEGVPFFAPIRELKEPENTTFYSFMNCCCRLEEQGIGEALFTDLLKRGQGVILLDGLDEVADSSQRLKVIGWIDNVRKLYGSVTFIITSRFAGYWGEFQLKRNLFTLSILDFTLDEIKTFLINWFCAVEEVLLPGNPGAQKKGKARARQLIRQIEKSEKLQTFVTNPLILQITALVHRGRGHLPERRVELYEECTNILLSQWDRAKEIKLPLTAKESRHILQPLALWLHQKEKRRSAPLEEIEKIILEPLEDIGRTDLNVREEILLPIRDRSGIFVGYHGEDYGFVHQSFQEYLAACQIRNKRQIHLLVQNYSRRWWREVILLCLAMDNPPVIEEFLKEIVKEPAFEEDISLVMDALKVSVVKPVRVLKEALEDNSVSEKAKLNIITLLGVLNTAKAEEALREIVRGKNKLLAGFTYTILKDKGKAEGLTAPKEILPAEIIHEKDGSEMVLIPAGIFLYGSREDDKEARPNEKPQRTIELEAFYMDKYPVTNKQYCRFLNEVKPDMEKLDKWIKLSGRSGNEKCRIKKQLNSESYITPERYKKYPVIYVTWYGADAYALWAGKRLPSEQEWEKAGRGKDGRTYSWGNTWDSSLCNSRKRGKGISPVDEFKEGQSKYGCFNMTGNIWDWTASVYDKNTGSYVLRGGSWHSNIDHCRSAFRLYRNPFFNYVTIGFRCAKSIPLQTP